MRENPVKRRLAEGGVALGTMVFEFATPRIGRLAAAAGAEFVVFDQEHTGWSIETVRLLIATTQGTDVVPIVRVPAAQYHLIAGVLDVGAAGVMVPMVEGAHQARLVVESAKYPPLGRRGVGLLDRRADEDLAATLEAVNREQLVIVQIETAAGLEHVDEIAAVEGVDVLWLGHFDLTTSLGIRGQFEHPTYLAALDRLVDAAARAGKTLGLMAGSIDDARLGLDRGFRAIAYSGDLWLYQHALRAGLDELRT